MNIQDWFRGRTMIDGVLIILISRGMDVLVSKKVHAKTTINRNNHLAPSAYYQI